MINTNEPCCIYFFLRKYLFVCKLCQFESSFVKINYIDFFFIYTRRSYTMRATEMTHEVQKITIKIYHEENQFTWLTSIWYLQHSYFVQDHGLDMAFRSLHRYTCVRGL